MISYHACHEICCDWTCDWVSQLITFNNMLNYVRTKLVSSPWLDLSSSSPMTWSNYFQSWSVSIEYYSLFFFALNYSDFNAIPFTFRVEHGARFYQSHSREYDWLCPEITRNKWGHYIIIPPEVLITLTCMVRTGPKSGSHYTPLVRRLL